MANYWTSMGVSRVRASENDLTIIPYGWKYAASRYPVVWCHGAGGDYHTGPIEGSVADTIQAPWACTDQGGLRTWGSDAVVTAVEADRTWITGLASARSGKAILVGGSMGGLTALLYTLANPTKVAALVLEIPAFDPEFVRNNDPGGGVNTTAINAVYGGGVVPTAKQGYQQGAALAATGVPTQLWYSTSDPFTPLASTQTFITASGCTAFSLGAVGHQYLNADPNVISSFIASRL